MKDGPATRNDPMIGKRRDDLVKSRGDEDPMEECAKWSPFYNIKKSLSCFNLASIQHKLVTKLVGNINTTTHV